MFLLYRVRIETAARRCIPVATTILCAVTWLFAVVQPARAAPGNNDFADAYVLVGQLASTNGSNVDATKEPGEQNHAGNAGGKSVWWNWTATTNGLVTIDTTGSSFDTLLAVYTGDSVSNLDLMARNDDGGPGNQSLLTFSPLVGTTYHIAVDGYNADSGSIVLNLNLQVVVQPNDQFTNRIAISGLSNSVAGSNIGATMEPGEPDHAGVAGGHSVWWMWTG